MKKKTARILSVLLAAVFALGAANSVLAARTLALDSGITLVEEGTTRRFVINADGTDLFQNFKGVMPGDDLVQTVRVNAAGANRESYRIFLYARECVEAEVPEGGAHVRPNLTDRDREFLRYLDITVSYNGEEIGDVNIGEGTGLSGVLLGTFAPGDSHDITVNLHVNEEMGNEFANKSAYIDWVFYADTIPETPDRPGPGDGGGGGGGGGDGGGGTPPTPPTDIADPDVPLNNVDIPDETSIEDPAVPLAEPPTEEEIEDEGVPLGEIPKTGDNYAIVIWLGLATASGAGIVILLTSKRKEENKTV